MRDEAAVCQERLVILVEIDEGQDNVNEGARIRAFARCYIPGLVSLHDYPGVRIVALEPLDGQVYPD